MAYHLTRRELAAALAASVAVFAASTPSASLADTVAAAAPKPILTVTGKVGASGPFAFDRPALEALGMVAFETKTPWHNGTVKFEGVSLDKLMKHVGATGGRVVAVALNDYSSEIPVEDFAKHNVILALKRDGEYMPVRDKGPLFIVYPYDSDAELRSQKFYSRSVWQVTRLEVK